MEPGRENAESLTSNRMQLDELQIVVSSGYHEFDRTLGELRVELEMYFSCVEK
ncbi:MAG TPA: hypothetical protein VMB05_14165 [Solirubrobacteraceae bacterium]|nr:hypothetical protein [Solirubrobacteraceae bacterium]